MSPLRPDEGSFRDPSSRVYPDADRVLRALSAGALTEFDAVSRARWFSSATRENKVVRSRLLDGPPASHGVPDTWAAVLEHPRLDVWTYPYEWSFSMLKAAAVLQLELLRDALAANYTCKDATPYNIQFDGIEPIFIDVGSFERLHAGDPWYGYLQFCQLFFYPLLLQAYVDLPYQPWLRAETDGITPDQAARLLGPLRLARKGVFIHVALHARAQRRFADTEVDIKSSLKASGFNKRLIEANVNGLLKTIGSLEWKRSHSTWSEYSDRSHYSDRDLAAKEDFVEAAVGPHRSLVWDVGCNDGHFSQLIAERADQILAMDSDALVVDVLYRRLRAAGPTNITPVVVDLANPAPGAGWRGRERRPFLERNQPDLVLCLAVVHHLALTNNVPTAEFLDLLVSLGCEAVVEFPTQDDPMVRRLLRNKKAGVNDGYSLARFEAETDERFEVEQRRELASKTRVLFHLRPK